MATPRIRETSLASVAFLGYAGGSGGTTLLRTGPGRIAGVFCSLAETTPLLALYDSTGASTGTIISVFTPASATMYNFGTDVIFSNGLYAATSSGSVKATFFISY